MPRLAQGWDRHHNLPLDSTQLVGRDEDIAKLCNLVLEDDGRLVTLTGVGGCGKTRLALRVASSMVGSFKDGVWWVSLAPLVDPQLVSHTVASVVGVRDRPDRAALDAVIAHLARRQVLLVLDNCEHLVKMCGEVAYTLLQGCPGLRLLATSREPLHISGERAWRVPSLALPDPAAHLSLEQLVSYPAVELFVKRAVAVQSDFVVSPANAPVVAALSARLEGMPLAIELAAAWVRALGVEQILERLDNEFGLLVDGSRSAPSRQQTMRATLDWSYGLLEEPEQLLFQRLAVFVGGWSLEAAEAICSGSGVALEEVLSLLTRLVDACLVQVEEHDRRARYRLLEPVRQYAHEYSTTSHELDAMRRQHTDFFLSFAQRWGTDANLGGPYRQAALAALGSEQDNLRAALRWCLEHGEAEKGLSLGRAHWIFWAMRGLFTEGQAWLTQLAALPGAASAPALRAAALSIAAGLARRQGSYPTALKIYDEVLPLLREAHDLLVLESALLDLGVIALQRGDGQGAQAHLEESLGSARVAGHRVTEALVLHFLARLALRQEAYTTARARAEESLGVARAAGDIGAQSISLNGLGSVMLNLGDLTTARRLLEEGVVLARQIGERFVLAETLQYLGQLATAEERYADARSLLRESLLLNQDLGTWWGVAQSLDCVAALAAAEAQARRAVQLAAAAASLREAIGVPLYPHKRAMLARWLVPLSDSLGNDTIRVAWDDGRDMRKEQALELALALTDAPHERPHRRLDSSGYQRILLTRREQEVAASLADGLSNRQIARRLVITERTVKAHVEHILDKLGLASRTQIALWAAEHDLPARDTG